MIPTEPGQRDETPEAAMRADIELRLRKACPDWTPSEFEKLVDEMVRIALKYTLGQR
jgi:hypothetical protein